MKRIFASTLMAAAISAQASAVVFDCRVEKKLDRSQTYSDEQLEQYRPRVLIDLRDDAAYLSRCSISMINGGIETCDKYKSDYAAFDANVDVSKFYVFESQFNVQLFPDGAFVEDNGRGTISFGTCKESVP